MSGESLLRGGSKLPALARPQVWWVGVLALAVVSWCVLVGLSPAHAHLPRQQLPAAARSFASSLFLIAGVVRLMRWRLAGDGAAARAGIALLVLGGAVRVHPLVGQSLTAAQPNPVIHTLCLAAVFSLLLVADRSDPLRSALSRCGAVIGAFGAVSVAVLGLRATHVADPSFVWVTVDGLAGMGWLVLARRAWVSGARTGCRTAPWVSAAMLLMAAGEWFLSCSVAGAAATTGIASGLQLAASAVAVGTSMAGLRETFAHEDTQNADATRVLATMQRQLARTRQVERERLHDARSAIVGVIAASDLLARGSAPDPRRVSRLMMAELTRLQTVLETDDEEPITEFDLAEVLDPVLQIHQLDGRTIYAQLSSLPVVGRARTTATVLDNLLRNARLHAPGAQIAVRADRSGPTATIVVEDDGPGVPPAEYELVLRPGGRGSSAAGPGSGLGLANALASMRAQGGSLELSGRTGGGTRITLTLPAADVDDRALAS